MTRGLGRPRCRRGRVHFGRQLTRRFAWKARGTRYVEPPVLACAGRDPATQSIWTLVRARDDELAVVLLAGAVAVEVSVADLRNLGREVTRDGAELRG